MLDHAEKIVEAASAGHEDDEDSPGQRVARTNGHASDKRGSAAFDEAARSLAEGSGGTGRLNEAHAPANSDRGYAGRHEGMCEAIEHSDAIRLSHIGSERRRRTR